MIEPTTSLMPTNTWAKHNNVEVVNKSYQKFWEDLELAGFKITPLTPINY